MTRFIAPRITVPILTAGSGFCKTAIFLGLVFAVFVGADSVPVSASDSWPQWRGPDQNGFAGKGEFPVQWNPQTNIHWKTPIRGNGGSTPVVAGSTAYLTTGVDGKNLLIAISIDDGTEKWSKVVGKDRGLKHRKGGGANPSPVVKDGLVYAYFRSGDLACFDAQGDVQWHVNLQEKYGKDELQWDLSTSPLMTKDSLVIAVVHRRNSFLLALDPKSGDQRWQVSRNLDAPKEANDSYTTPISLDVDGREAIAVLGADHLTLHDAADGSLMGKVGGLNPDQRTNFRSISSPVASGNYVICPYARGDTVTTFDAGKLADGAGDEVMVWFRDDVGSDVPTPATFKNQVIFVGGLDKQRGTVSGLDIKTGKTLWSLQVPLSRHDFSSSPIVAGKHLFVTGEEGTTHVIGPLDAETPRLISSNPLDDDKPYTRASPIAAGKSIFIRTKNYLYRVTAKK